MTLFSNYKVLPYSIACDTVFLCYNPYFDIQFKQCYQFKDMLSLIEETPSTYKLILLAQTFEEGLKQIATINRLKQIKEQSKTREKDSQGQDDDCIKDELNMLAKSLQFRQQNKSSFLHLKCLLNKTQQKISSLNQEIREKFEKQTAFKLDKKIKKCKKIHEKQLQSLKQKRMNLQRQISTQQNKLWWKQQPKQIYKFQSQQSCEDLLSDSEQKKENKVYL